MSQKKARFRFWKQFQFYIFLHHDFFVEWTEFSGGCRDENNKEFDTWRIDSDRYGKIPLDKCKPLCQALEPCVACQCYDANGYPDPRNNYCRVLTADDADPAVMNGVTLEHEPGQYYTSKSYPTKGDLYGNNGWAKLYSCHVKPLGKNFNSNWPKCY